MGKKASQSYGGTEPYQVWHVWNVFKKKNNFAMYNCLATENKLTGIILDRSPRHVETVTPILHIENDSNKDALQKSAVADRLWVQIKVQGTLSTFGPAASERRCNSRIG